MPRAVESAADISAVYDNGIEIISEKALVGFELHDQITDMDRDIL